MRSLYRMVMNLGQYFALGLGHAIRSIDRGDRSRTWVDVEERAPQALSESSDDRARLGPIQFQHLIHNMGIDGRVDRLPN